MKPDKKGESMADTKAKLLKQKEEIEEKLKALDEKEKKGFVIRNRYDDSEVYVSKADNLRDAVLEAVGEEADLQEADLREADLRGADLQEADLQEADLQEADLRGADLRGADLEEANLQEADLRGADLQEADLGYARFYGKGGTQKLKKDQVEDFLRALGFEIE